MFTRWNSPINVFRWTRDNHSQLPVPLMCITCWIGIKTHPNTKDETKTTRPVITSHRPEILQMVCSLCRMFVKCVHVHVNHGWEMCVNKLVRPCLILAKSNKHCISGFKLSQGVQTMVYNHKMWCLFELRPPSPERDRGVWVSHTFLNGGHLNPRFAIATTGNRPQASNFHSVYRP